MTVERRTNWIGGEWCSAASGAAFTPPGAAAGEAWPQSGREDVLAALTAAGLGQERWRRTGPGERAEHVNAVGRALARDAQLFSGVERALALAPGDLERQRAGIGAPWEPARHSPGGLALLACDWRDLARDAFAELARELLCARVVVLFSDPRLPDLGLRLARAAEAAALPPGVLGLVHGMSRELLGLTLALEGEERPTLVASGSAERIVDLRRLCETRGVRDPRLRALRCGAYALDPERELAESAAEVVELAFGREQTLSGQLPGSLGRVHCPQRLHSRFTECLLASLAASPAARAPLPQIDAEAAERVRAAWALGLDEGATLIAGGEEEARGERIVAPTVFTNVEAFMASARRQEPVPVLCLLRAG